jgi:hypothetical protein
MPAFTVTLQATKLAPITITATSTPTETVTPTATPDIAATVIAISEPRIYSSFLSPDGKWRSEVVIYDCVEIGPANDNAYEQLKLIHIDTGVEK